MDLHTRIERQTTTLIRNIRQYAEAQKSYWVKVPFLALQADGRSGYNEMYASAYHSGLWQIFASVQNGHYRVCVDLEDGRLVQAFDPRKPAHDADVLDLATHLQSLDAALIVAELEEKAKEEISSFIPAPKDPLWREHLAKKRGIFPDRYARKGRLAKSSIMLD